MSRTSTKFSDRFCSEASFWFFVLCSLFFVLCSLFFVLCSSFFVLCSLFINQPKNPFPTQPTTNQQPTFRCPSPDPTPVGFPLPTTSSGTGLDPVALISPLISFHSRKIQPQANGLAKSLAPFLALTEERSPLRHSPPIPLEQIRFDSHQQRSSQGVKS